MNKEGDLTEGVGGMEGNTLRHMMYIHKLRLNHYPEHEREGRGRE